VSYPFSSFSIEKKEKGKYGQEPAFTSLVSLLSPHFSRAGRKEERDGSVCKVRTQEAENFDEEVKSLVSAWRSLTSSSVKFSQPHVLTFSPFFLFL